VVTNKWDAAGTCAPPMFRACSEPSYRKSLRTGHEAARRIGSAPARRLRYGLPRALTGHSASIIASSSDRLTLGRRNCLAWRQA
jgi:hypothetical protein